MKIGKCSNCGNNKPIVPVSNPKKLCSKCWMEDRG